MKTENEAKHTPTPWRTEKQEIFADPKLPGYHGERVIAKAFNIGSNREQCSRGLANAEFIVRAVNSHEALLRMLKKVFADGAGIHYEEIAETIRQAEVRP